MRLSRRAVYQLARDVGLDHDAALVATAIAEGESGRETDAVGDESLQDDTWGPSLGLWQVRSLKADRGTGRERDADRLLDPAFNARAMVAISGNGFTWRPWTIWKNGTANRLLPAIRAEIEGGGMELWHPRATRVRPDSRSGVTYINVPWKIVLHTTESYGYSPSTASYFGSQSWPHSTIHTSGIYQHFPIDVGAYALYHGGWPETNAARAIQCEICWYAQDASNMPDELLAHVADWVGWVAEQTATPLTFAQFVAYPASYGENAAQRFPGQDWLDFNGVCGHQHVPSGNDHGDPGLFPVERLNLEDDVLKEDERNSLIFIGQVLNDIKHGVEKATGKPLTEAIAELLKPKK